MEIELGDGRKVVCTLGVEALVIYEQEFGGDLIKDLFGKVELRDEQSKEGVIYSVDYRDTNWTIALRVLWAGVKTEDEATPSFKDWAKKIGAVDMNSIVNAIYPEAWRMFFRAGASDTE